MMTIQNFNESDKHTKATALNNCCGCERWVASLLARAPYASGNALVQRAIDCWYNECSEADWLEAFSHHPKIGDRNSLQQKYAGQEQQSISTATNEIIEALMQANQRYEEKNGFIFIVCATGKSAAEMLALLQDRLVNSREEELRIAMGEQIKITLIRLQQLFDAGEMQLTPCQLTSHVLDTSLGKPGKGISIHLYQSHHNGWQKMSQGITNEDGRVSDLLPPGRTLVPGAYKLAFETGAYYQQAAIKSFYPVVELQFLISDDSHYHVPLLINPFGYSTYRGS